ncbi:hypothetical protein SAMN04488029_3664 [Reichenbachiella faecimaris]|uniref:Mannose-1-phosphate guanylyltransferase n=1 Tax=Reichenbachiella faecimaris TaxID=692418 RepID=A0A1W2GND5_REIFA|nr:hypothetical protein [Reichenbachiella faecimaris]SMD38173.1 hypothetical protein SAMN04488029_3664 [Reichenbachiella faecimaris]
MQSRIMYIEHKTDQNDRGEAWIGMVEFSKSGQTVYFNGHAYKKLKSGGTVGNFYDIESEDEFWISGVKKNRQDRHWAGSGKIKIEKAIIEEYLNIVDFSELDEQHYELGEPDRTDKRKFLEIENEKIE